MAAPKEPRPLGSGPEGSRKLLAHRNAGAAKRSLNVVQGQPAGVVLDHQFTAIFRNTKSAHAVQLSFECFQGAQLVFGERRGLQTESRVTKRHMDVSYRAVG